MTEVDLWICFNHLTQRGRGDRLLAISEVYSNEYFD